MQEHEIALFTEVARRYDLDGILLDRGRYDNIQSDFSDFSRRAFEAYIGQPVERFPEDIFFSVYGNHFCFVNLNINI